MAATCPRGTRVTLLEGVTIEQMHARLTQFVLSRQACEESRDPPTASVPRQRRKRDCER
jgi:hypothetical protein